MKYLKSNYAGFSILISFMLFISCNQSSETNQEKITNDYLDIESLPDPPGENTWKFIEDLSSPLWTKHPWEAKGAGSKQADLTKGVTIRENFPDHEGCLETAYEDLRVFLAAGNVSASSGEYQIETVSSADLEGESFKLEVGPKSCKIFAGDAEGIRRGIFQIEDEMLRIRGPYLPLGTTEKHPVVKRRISRCVYGPIKRPPLMRDELMDDIDYYPDHYMNRLAHEGVNGLWLTVDFRDLVSTKYTPEAAKDGKKRLEKLRKTVAQNLRYGIRTYIFTIEPRAWGNQPPRFNDKHVLDKYPELGGAKMGDITCFCPFSETAQQYLYQVVNTIFREVPGLGGMINISQGERYTTCMWSVDQRSPFIKGSIDCPRCSKKEPWEILYSSLSAMERGMHDASPNAELISWLYIGSNLADWIYEIPAHTPKGVIAQFNFETGVTKTEFGKKLVGGDYWLATPGPSEDFERRANIAREHGTQVSAKIQTGNSHEVASIPYVPVPSMVYRKFSAMHRLGVSHTMLAWFFGNYPGLMIKSAGELSFSPFPEGEDTFLNQLATIYWKEKDVPMIVEAWKHFAEGYGNYPLQAIFGYYGPMHDGPVWPLLLKPLDAYLCPNWLIGSPYSFEPYAPSGDRIGECIGGGRDGSMENVLTLEETIELCSRMTTMWDKGVDILNKLEPGYQNEPERIQEIGLAKALGIQFRSGYNILRFYKMREKMFRMEGRERLDILKQLEDIIREELEMDEQLIKLCEKDSRLGFNSEAEGYKYFPEKIRWRMQQLRDVLANDMPEIKKHIRNDKLLFPEYTGKEPAGAVAYAIHSTGGSGSGVPGGLQWQPFTYGTENAGSLWAAAYDEDTLYIYVSDPADMNQSRDVSEISGITVRIEARRLWPGVQYTFSTGAESRNVGRISPVKESGKWYVMARIPFKSFWWSEEESHPIRMDVRVQKRESGTSSWRPNNPIALRLVYGSDNPADLGWLVFRD